RLQRLAHDGDVAGAVEGIVGAADLVRAALGHIDEVRDQIVANLLRIDEVRHAEALAPFLLVVVDVDPDDHVGAGKPQPLNDIEADAAEPEYDAFRTRFYLGGVEHGADAGGDAAADVADLVEGSILANLGNRNLRQHRKIRERGGAHVMVQLLAADREARGAVRHDALALRRADGGAQIGLARQAGRTLPAFRRIERNNVIALFRAGDARADIDDDAGALMAEHRREQPLRVGAREREFVGMADAGRFYLDHYLPSFRAVQVHLGYFQRLGLLECDGSTGFHDDVPLLFLVGTNLKQSPHGRRRQSGGGEGCGPHATSHWSVAVTVIGYPQGF